MDIGDIVKRADGARLRSGAEAYEDAVVVALEPLVLVSRGTDMRWNSTVQDVDFIVVGKASAELLEKCKKRL